ncbi:DMT family transporter [Streptomyces sp. NPDC003042]
MAWLYLAIAIVFEIAFALGTNAAKGFTKLWPSVFTVLAAACGVYALSLSLRTLDVAVGYTIWTGVGAVGTVALASVLYKERITLPKIASFAAIIGGVVLLKFSASL